MAEKYITLKEAAKMTGYAPDYLGQLIRKGKLPGKQIYLNVAWVTTETAVKKYMSQQGVAIKGPGFLARLREKVRTWAIAHTTAQELVRMARGIIYIVIAILFAFVLFLIYAFGANLGRRMNGGSAPGNAYTTVHEP